MTKDGTDTKTGKDVPLERLISSCRLRHRLTCPVAR